MKKLFVSVVASFGLVSQVLAADAQQELSERLALTKGFSAKFEQTVTSPDGEIVMEGEGSVDIARPSLFNWHTDMPDENILVSDGKTLWYYSPFIEQVSIFDQQAALAQTPFVLLTRNSEEDWANYNVDQKDNVFTLTPVNADSSQGQFQIIIDDKGKATGFNVLEQDGQKAEFTFTDVTLEVPDSSKFTFEIPDGVEVDDQRN